MASRQLNLSPDAETFPSYATDQLACYAPTTTSARRGYMATEVASITAAAGVPVAVAAAGPHWLTAALGAAAAIATGLRQAFNYRENWMLPTVAPERIKAAVARFLGGDRSADQQTQLIAAIEHVSRSATARWQQLLSHTGAAPNKTSDQRRGDPPTQMRGTRAIMRPSFMSARSFIASSKDSMSSSPAHIDDVGHELLPDRRKRRLLADRALGAKPMRSRGPGDSACDHDAVRVSIPDSRPSGGHRS